MIFVEPCKDFLNGLCQHHSTCSFKDIAQSPIHVRAFV